MRLLKEDVFDIEKARTFDDGRDKIGETEEPFEEQDRILDEELYMDPLIEDPLVDGKAEELIIRQNGPSPIRFLGASNQVPPQEDLLCFSNAVVSPINYPSENRWETNVSFLSASGPVSSVAKPFASLDELVEFELKRRLGEATFKNLSHKRKEELKQQIAISCVNRHDFTGVVALKEEICKQYGLGVSSFSTRHEFLKNSPLNGLSYLDEHGNVVSIYSAICASGDRHVENLQMARQVIFEKNQQVICYTGRPDTLKKALEQGQMIFLNEINQTKPRGISYLAEEAVHTLTYIVFSLMDACKINTEEAEIFQRELKTLQELQKEIHVVTDAKGKKYWVKYCPILLTKQMNIYNRFESILPSRMSGKGFAKDTNAKGIEELQVFFTESEHSEDMDFNTLVADIFAKLTSADVVKMSPQELTLLISHLSDLLNIPIVVHCKSCKDRTSIAIAIACALMQWLELGLKLPRDNENTYHPEQLVNEPLFKELFCANLLVNLQVTKYGMSFGGTLDHQIFKDDKMGFNVHSGLLQNPILISLLPDRYLKSAGGIEKLLHQKVIDPSSSLGRKNMILNNPKRKRRPVSTHK